MSQMMTVARPYAEAAFQFAREHGQVNEWANFLESLASVAANSDIQRLDHSPKIDAEDLVGVITQLTEVSETSKEANFVRLLIDNKRLKASAEIAKRFTILRNQAQDMLDVVMVTAVSITEGEKTAYAGKFTTLLGRKVLLHCETDKDILGGFIIRYGDKVIDSSIRGQLNKLAACLEE